MLKDIVLLLSCPILKSISITQFLANTCYFNTKREAAYIVNGLGSDRDIA